MADDDDQPVTKGFLRGELAQQGAELRGEMRQQGDELRGEMAQLGADLRGEMQAMEERIVLGLSGVIQRAMNIAVEQIGSKISVVDEKYQDLPGRVTAVERDVADLKARLPPAAPRTRRAPRTK